ncbi:hypothetical protein [Leptolyngbya sp. FACHB-261]|uniref:pPIWI_RE_Y domain-containing protein n=1 Tax=Leptolyngbya sp. FACHB-261 TaxID=2692806 RepID=UPI0016890CA7|nr:hypothetical protein [Leptolyngbya sp. FACHB-261]MBD2100533.1 hypothetical protein [Leptolyngbya sp. FACHB-261]
MFCYNSNPWKDEETLRLIARGVITYSNNLDRGNPPNAYPPSLVKGLRYLRLACKQHKIEEPMGSAELLRWCQEKPLRTWPLSLYPNSVGWGSDLLIDPDTRQPTPICESWAYLEQVEQ